MGVGEKDAECLGHGGNGCRTQLYKGIEVSVWSLKPGSGAFPVVLPPGDGAAAMSRTAGSSTMRLYRGWCW